jgi:MFS family permease
VKGSDNRGGAPAERGDGGGRGSAPVAGVRASARPYYGWVLVTALAVTEITSWGALYYAFTVFLDPMHAALGWSTTSMAGAFSLALLLSGIVGVPLGHWLDRYGPRLPMVAGACVAVLLLVAWSRVTSLLAFYLIWAGLGIAMAAVLYEPAFWVVSVWFTRRRRQALTLLTLVAGMASVIYVPLAGWLVATQGWRHALVWLAMFVAVGTVPVYVVVLRRKPADLGLAPDGDPPSEEAAGAQSAPQAGVDVRVALRGSTFWLLTCAFTLSTLGTGTVFVYLVPYLTARGYTPGAAAGFVGLIGLIALPGRLVLTPLGDWLPRGWVTASLFAFQALSLAVLLEVGGTVGVVLFAILFGAVFGAITPARAALLMEYFGPAHFGSINGALGVALYAARGLAPVSAAAITEMTGSYQVAFGGLAGLAAVAALASVLADRRAAPPVPSPDLLSLGE